MAEFDDEYRSAIEAGQRNLKAQNLIKNWCGHAEIIRSPGRGLLESMTHLPIGHMGVQCKYSKNGSILSFLLEDAAYEFYQNNCKNCSKRIPVGTPNILEFVVPREKAVERQREKREAEEAKRSQEQVRRREERAELRINLTFEESLVLNLLDDLDQEGIEKNDPRLEQLANLAPETFTKEVIKYLLPAVLHQDLPYSVPAAKALLRTSLNRDQKLAIAVRLVSNFVESSLAIDEVLAGAERLSHGDLERVLRRFVSMALGPPPGGAIGIRKIRINPLPIRSLFSKRRADVCQIVDKLISDSDPFKISKAVEIILATDDEELLAQHTRNIIAKLMRRRTLLPAERRDSRVIYYLRLAVTACLDRYPEKADNEIQSFLRDHDEIGRDEAYKAYRSVLRHDFRKKAIIGQAQRIAFKRLLWASAARPENAMDEPGQFFRHSWSEFAELASEHFDELIGAAANLTQSIESTYSDSSIELPDNPLSEIERDNRRSAIAGLQSALIEWATVGAKYKGREGIREFLNLYRRLPEDQEQMRGNMIAHVSKLLTGVESLTLVLSDWYRALMHESVLIRAKAAEAWESVPHHLVRDFPDLFFQAYSVLLSDPYVVVHRRALESLRRRSFPKEKRELIKNRLWVLVILYAKEGKESEFLVSCVETYAYLCLSAREREGEMGQLLSNILLNLEGRALYHAVDRLWMGFAKVPDFSKVALKAIQDDYTRSISTDDCIAMLLRAPREELKNCVDDIKRAFKALKPYRPEGFFEALVYAALLTKAGNHAVSAECFQEMLAEIPVEDRSALWRIQTSLIATASQIELSIGSGDAFYELVGHWKTLLSDLEKENEERAKLRDFPPSFFFEG